MITPFATAIIMCVTGIILLFIIPMLDGSERFGKYISLRYTLTVTVSMMALGCILDFSHLSETPRNITITGALFITCLFVILRSLEKMKLGGKRLELEISKGDAKAKATLSGVENGNEKA